MFNLEATRTIKYLLSTYIDDTSGQGSTTRLAISAGDHWRCSEQGRYREARNHDGQPIWTQANRGVG